jgi:hypothetical protein
MILSFAGILPSFLMIVRHLYIVSVAVCPNETHPVPIVYPDAVLALSVPSQLLQAIARGYT